MGLLCSGEDPTETGVLKIGSYVAKEGFETEFATAVKDLLANKTLTKMADFITMGMTNDTTMFFVCGFESEAKFERCREQPSLFTERDITSAATGLQKRNNGSHPTIQGV